MRQWCHELGGGQERELDRGSGGLVGIMGEREC